MSAVSKLAFKPVADVYDIGTNVVVPGRGVGRVAGVETTIVMGESLDVTVITLDASKLTIRIPNDKLTTATRLPSTDAQTWQKALKIISGTSRKFATGVSGNAGVLKKIASGDLFSLAEVVRDSKLSILRDNVGTVGPAHSGRWPHQEKLQAAMDLIVGELAAAARIDRHSAMGIVEDAANGKIINPFVQEANATAAAEESPKSRPGRRPK